MLTTLPDAVTNADLAQPFTILRNVGQFAAGGWQSTQTVISAYGTVTVAEDIYLEMIPEADRVHGAMLFISTTPIYQTSELREDGTSGTSDLLVHAGKKFRVLKVGPYLNRGFNYAVGVRMLGT
jgi:hypothetical protein